MPTAEEYKRSDCIAYFWVAIVVMLLWGLAGCAPPAANETGHGWTAVHESAWRDVEACWGYESSRPRPDVLAKGCTIDAYGNMSFEYWGGRYLGIAWPLRNFVNVCEGTPEVGLLRHEFSHVVVWEMEGMRPAFPGGVHLDYYKRPVTVKECFGVARTPADWQSRNAESREQSQ